MFHANHKQHIDKHQRPRPPRRARGLAMYWWRLFAQAVTVCSAAAVVAAVFFHAGDKPLSYREAVSRALPSVASIYGREDNGALSSLGAGVIVSADGYILTNYHIIANAPAIEAGLQDGALHTAQLVGIDPDIDIAVLRVRAKNDLPAMSAAKDALEPGDVVFAIGNPFGLNRSTTMGIVSATGRDRLGLHDFERFIQTDAAINPGSSGGALADARGRLVGINSALFYRAHGIPPQGIGFAIPAALALRSYGRLLQDESPPAFGAQLRALPPRLRSEALGDSRRQAAALVVSRLWQNTPAARMQLRVGDIILKINHENPLHYLQENALSSAARHFQILRGAKTLTAHRLTPAADSPQTMPASN